MAPTRKRSARKRSRAKGSSAKKRPVRKAGSRRRTKGAAKRSSAKSSLKRQARKGIRAAKGGLKTVRQAGERTWEVLKSTTAQVVEGVKDKMSDSSPA